MGERGGPEAGAVRRGIVLARFPWLQPNVPEAPLSLFTGSLLLGLRLCWNQMAETAHTLYSRLEVVCVLSVKIPSFPAP